jgi:hypothetical protein
MNLAAVNLVVDMLGVTASIVVCILALRDRWKKRKDRDNDMS